MSEPAPTDVTALVPADGPLVRDGADRERVRALLEARLGLAYLARAVATRREDGPAGNRADAEVDALLALYRPLLGDRPPDKRRAGRPPATTPDDQ